MAFDKASEVEDRGCEEHELLIVRARMEGKEIAQNLRERVCVECIDCTKLIGFSLLPKDLCDDVDVPYHLAVVVRGVKRS